MSERYSYHQQRIGDWEAAMIPSFLNTPKIKFNRALEEVKELHDAISADDGTQAARHEIGSEAVDVIIRMIGIATIVGTNVERTLDNKITETTEYKYNPAIIRANMDRGMSWPQAMGEAKTVWQANGSSSPPHRV